jgi:hypothetical protein
MPSPIPVKSTVNRSALSKKRMPEAITSLQATVASGAVCPEVTGSPVAAAALANLEAAVATSAQSVSVAADTKIDAQAATRQAQKDFQKVRIALSTYETAVIGVAGGDAAIIHQAGLEARPEAPVASPPITKLAKLTSEPWKLSAEARLRWPEMAGAAMYAVQVNFTPQNAGSSYTVLGTTTRLTKVVKAPTAGAQFLAQVAPVSSDGTVGEWSDAVLATAR